MFRAAIRELNASFWWRKALPRRGWVLDRPEIFWNMRHLQEDV